MKLIDTQIEVNEDFIPNSNITYDIYWDGKLNFEARININSNRGKVMLEEAPKTIKYVMDKPLFEFTKEEKQNILNYRGLSLENDGFEASDVFMEKSNLSLVLTIKKSRFAEWYFNYGQDQENETTRLKLAESIIDQLIKTGVGSYSVDELFENCNQEAIRAYYTEEFDMRTDDFDLELSDLGFDYKVTLID